jgi:hypothetical protein
VALAPQKAKEKKFIEIYKCPDSMAFSTGP